MPKTPTPEKIVEAIYEEVMAVRLDEVDVTGLKYREREEVDRVLIALSRAFEAGQSFELGRPEVSRLLEDLQVEPVVLDTSKLSPEAVQLFAVGVTPRFVASIEVTPEVDAVEIGRTVARRIFKARGDHTEIHLSEGELAAVCAIAAEGAADQATKKGV